MLQRTHQCDRCGAPIEPGDVYGAIDGVDADGQVRVLLCRGCSAAFRRFLDGGQVETPEKREARAGANADHEADRPQQESEPE